MMRKTALALTLLFTVSIFFGGQFANLVGANWIPSGPYITVVSPTNMELTMLAQQSCLR